jgi:hypothetical protein
MAVAGADIMVIKFTQTFEKGRDGNLEPCDWVTWVPRLSPQTTETTEKLRQIDPNKVRLAEGADGGEKLGFMRAKWAVIEPAYMAWKEGREVPANGTPLAAWPGITPEQAEVFRLSGIRSVEQVRDMNDGLRARVRLPNLRELQDLARVFLENTGAAASAEREAAKDRQIAEMGERLQAMEEMLQRQMLSSMGTAPDDEAATLRADLEAKGIPYDKRWGAAKLREALEGKAAA